MAARPVVALAARMPPALAEAALILRLGGESLAAFLRYHANPCLSASLPSPPPAAAPAPDYRDRIRENNMLTQPPSLRREVAALIDFLGDEGYLALPDEWHDAAPAGLEPALAQLRRCADAGVGARSMRESLQWQLQDLDDTPARAAALRALERHWQWVKKKRWDRLAPAHRADAIRLLEQLRLPPHPSAAPAAPAMPDIAFARQRGLWKALAAPGLELSARYQPAADSTARERLEARRIVAAVRARRRWVLRLATLAADRQSDFFEEGPTRLRPLTMAQAAQLLGVSAAMISHIIRDKQFICAHGVFHFKQLFSGRTNSGALRARMQECIAQEDKRRPLSDVALQKELMQAGFFVSARMIGKHRRHLHIPSASMRKRLTPSS